MIVVSIDPGMETGIVVFDADPGARPELVDWGQFEGGLPAIAPRLRALMDLYGTPWDDGTEYVCEKFSPRPGARSWRLNELEPIRIEGALEALYGDAITYRRPEARKLIDNSLSATEGLLRWADYWRLPRHVGRPDANDANAAIMHALGHLRDKAHMPTINMLIEYGDIITEADL